MANPDSWDFNAGYNKAFFQGNDSNTTAVMTLGINHILPMPVPAGGTAQDIPAAEYVNYVFYNITDQTTNFNVNKNGIKLVAGISQLDPTDPAYNADGLFTLDDLNNGVVKIEYNGTSVENTETITFTVAKIDAGNNILGNQGSLPFNILSGTVNANWSHAGGTNVINTATANGTVQVNSAVWSNSLTLTCSNANGAETVVVKDSDIVNAISNTLTIPTTSAGSISLTVNQYATDNLQTLTSGSDNTAKQAFIFDNLNTTTEFFNLIKTDLNNEFSGTFNIPMTPYSVAMEVVGSNSQLVPASQYKQSAQNVLVRINDNPSVTTNTGVNVARGTSNVTTITQAMLETTDTAGAVLTYTLTTVPASGVLTLNNSSLSVGDTFTQANINAGNLKFTSPNTGGALSFSTTLTDGIMATPLSAFSFNITVNASPAQSALTGLTVAENATATVGQGNLEFTDADNTPAQVVYTLTAVPTKGTLRKNGSVLANSNTFTQQNINDGIITYVSTSEVNSVSDDTFKFTVQDGNNTPIVTETTFTITRGADNNDAPLFSGNATVSATEDGSTILTNAILASSDPDGVATTSDLTYQLQSIASGTIEKYDGSSWSTVAPNGTFTQKNVNDSHVKYVTTSNFNGSTSFVLKLTDGDSHGYGDNITVNVTVTAVDDAIVVTNTSATIQEDTADNVIGNGGLAGTLSSSDVDVDNTTLKYVVTNLGGLNGTLKLNGTALAVNDTFTQAQVSAGNLTYTPTINFDQIANFKFKVSQSDGTTSLTSEQTFSISVQNAGNAPVIAKKTLTLNEDPEGENVAGGQSGAGGATFITNTDLTITDTNSTLANITIKLKNLTNLNGSLTNVSTSTQLVTDSTFTMQDVTDGNKIKYTPTEDFNGSASFTFQVYDEHNDFAVDNGSSTHTFSITVNAVNDIPLANMGSVLTTNEDTTSSLTTTNLTSSDVESDSTQFVIITAPANGTLKVSRNGSDVALSGMGGVYNIQAGNYFTQAELATNASVKYTPSQHYYGSDSFTFKLKDAQMSQAEFESTTLNPLKTQQITVNSINDGISLTNQAQTLAEDAPATSIYPKLSVTDIERSGTGFPNTVEKDQLIFTVTNIGSLNGVLTNDGNTLNTANLSNTFTQADLEANKVKYEPLNNYNGSASFTFNVTDGQGSTLSNKVFSMSVTSTNDNLIFVKNNTLVIDEDNTGSLSNTLEFKEVVIEGGSTLGTGESTDTQITYTITDVTNLHGILYKGGVALNTYSSDVANLVGGGPHFNQADLKGAGSTLTYTPGTNYNGSASFVFTVQDSNGYSLTGQTYNITINQVWDNMSLTNQGLSLNEDAGLVIITNTMLKVGQVSGPDGNQAPSQALPADITYTITSVANLNGSLFNDGSALNATAGSNTFTQADINNNKVKYQVAGEYNNKNANGNSSNDGSGETSLSKASFDFNVVASNTNGNDALNNNTFNIDVMQVNDVPSKDTLITLDVVEEGTVTLTNANLKYVEVQYNSALAPNESNTSHIKYTITSVDNLNGSLTNDSVALNATAGSNTFTQADIDGDKIVFTPSQHFNGSAQFTFEVTDHANAKAITPNTNGTQTFTFNVTTVNDHPLILTGNNNGLTLLEDTPTLIESDDLLATEVQYNGSLAPSESSPANLTFTLLGMTSLNGNIQKSDGTTWTNVAVDGTWTQQDINNDLIRYNPQVNYNGAASFTFKVTDPNSGLLDNQTFSITVNTVNDGPIISVNNTVQTNEDTSVFVTSSSLQTVEVKLDGGNANVDGSNVASSESNPSNITYTITDFTNLNGTITRTSGGSTTAIGSGNPTFTQAEVNTGTVIGYSPTLNYNNSVATNNYVTFTVKDGHNAEVSGSKLYFRVVQVNDVPILVNNTGLTVNRKSVNNIISNSALKFREVYLGSSNPGAGTSAGASSTNGQGTTESSDANLTYKLTDVSELNGSVTRNGTNVGLNGTFTQADVNNNLVKYTPTSTFHGWAKFNFTITDSGSPTKSVSGVFNMVVNSNTASAGAGGDPYIQPVNGQLYKIPVDSNNYRMFDNLGVCKKGEEVVINAKMDLLYTGEKALADENRSKWEEYMNNNEKEFVTDAESFIRYLFFNVEGEQQCVDLETLTFVEAPEGMTLDKAVTQRKTVPSTKPLNNLVIQRDEAVRSKFWGKTFPVYKDVRGECLKIAFNTKTHGAVMLTLMSFEQLQEFRTSVQITCEKNITQSNASGLLVAKTKKGQLKNFTNSEVNKKMFFSNGGRVKEDKITLFTNRGIMEHAFTYVQ